jgi:hypothetical protein
MTNSNSVGALHERQTKHSRCDYRAQGGMSSVVFAGSIGIIIEWYDFLIYGTAA